MLRVLHPDRKNGKGKESVPTNASVELLSEMLANTLVG